MKQPTSEDEYFAHEEAERQREYSLDQKQVRVRAEQEQQAILEHEHDREAANGQKAKVTKAGLFRRLLERVWFVAVTRELSSRSALAVFKTY